MKKEVIAAFARVLDRDVRQEEAGRFAVSDTIERIGGAEPKTFVDFAREHRQEFAAPPARSAAQMSDA